MAIKLAENFRAVFYAPFYATRTLGFFAREGVDVELIDSANPGDAVSGVLDGSIDITWGGPMRVMKARDGAILSQRLRRRNFSLTVTYQRGIFPARSFIGDTSWTVIVGSFLPDRIGLP
jgi:uncharacterized membrane protein